MKNRQNLAITFCNAKRQAALHRWPQLAVTWFALLAAMTVARAQQDFSKVEIKVTKVAGSVYMLEGSGGNIGVSVGEDGIVMVDDQFAPLAPKIKEALRGITDRPIKVVL